MDALTYSSFTEDQRYSHETRKSVFSGSWYPGTEQDLAAAVDSYIARSDCSQIKGDIIAIVSPHAGHVYSGPVAACAYKTLINKAFDVVIIFGNAHSMGFQGAAIDSVKAYSNPLGTVHVDRELAEEIVKMAPAVHFDNSPHTREHSLEIQLPFLQRTLKQGFKILPILFGFHDAGAESQIIKALYTLLQDKRFLLIASTDLTHFPNYNDAREADTKTLDLIASLDTNALRRHDEETMAAGIPGLQCTLCALTATSTVMKLSRHFGAKSGTVLKYANSGDMNAGDHNRVVGYGAVVFTVPPQEKDTLDDFKTPQSDQSRKS